MQSLERAELYLCEANFSSLLKNVRRACTLASVPVLSGRAEGGCKCPGSCTPSRAVPLMLCNREDNVVGSICSKCSPARGRNHEQTGKDVETPIAPPTLTCTAGAALVAGGGEAPAALSGSSGHYPSHELYTRFPSCRPDPAALGGDCSWTLLRKTSSGMLSAASSVMQSGSLQLGSKVSWILAKAFIGAQ